MKEIIKIQTIWLFTNRNTLFFNEKGEQISELQKLVSWKNEKLKDSDLLKLMEIITNQNPKIYISKWKKWYNEISADEFFALLGYGYEYYLFKAGLRK